MVGGKRVVDVDSDDGMMDAVNGDWDEDEDDDEDDNEDVQFVNDASFLVAVVVWLLL